MKKFIATKKAERYFSFVILVIVCIIMIYPLTWLVGSSFKYNEDIFIGLNVIPERATLSGYIDGWRGVGRFTYTTFFINTFVMVVPTVIGTLVSSFLVAYGFARFSFRFHSILFMTMLATLMLPNELLIIPRFIMFKNFGWLNTYLPIIIPAWFATFPFFIFMAVQFIKGIPRELDESAVIDGCNTFSILWRIILPLSKPVIFSAMIFQFVWRWNDFFNPLIFINSMRHYPLSLALRLSMDLSDMVSWNNALAMSVLAIIPPTMIFFAAQKYFVEGIATSGIKG